MPNDLASVHVKSFMAGMIFAVLISVSVSASQQPLLVGIVQVDGTVIPFAEYKSNSWQHTWTMDERPDELPNETKILDVSQIPGKWTGYSSQAFSQWYLSSTNQHNAPFRISRARLIPMHCGELWALESDLPKREAPENTFPEEKSGIAFTTKENFVAMASIQKDSKVLGILRSFVQSIFDPLDRAVHPQYSDAGDPSDLSIDVLLRSDSTIGNKHWYYVEAKRTYKKKMAAAYSCPSISFFTGWIEETASGQLHFLQKNFYPTDCDMKEVIRDWPFGILSIDKRLYVFGQATGYESESYTISTLDPEGVHSVLAGSGGGC